MEAFITTRMRERNYLKIILFIVISTSLIFYADIITPLGFAVWILYFIPLVLTLYLQWKFAPIAGAGFFVLLVAISYFFSPRDISELFAIINRLFFSVMLIVTAILITRYKQSIEDLHKSERKYRYLTDWSPDAIMVQQEGKIVYTNPAGQRLFMARTNEELLGKNILNLFSPDERKNISQKLDQALLGEKMQIPQTSLVRLDGRRISVEGWLGEIIWDGKNAVEIILRELSEDKLCPSSLPLTES
jgi:PAS domain S-box-containing protein